MIELTIKEFALLEYLMRNAGGSVTRTMIIEHVWNLSFDSSTNLVDVYINYIWARLKDGPKDSDISFRISPAAQRSGTAIDRR
jgi:DNA-binding response OmpR family regulator